MKPPYWPFLNNLSLADSRKIDEWYLLALCIWREAQGETFEGKVAVGWAIKNRVEHPSWWGNTYHRVILQPFQFSSFNKNDPNATKIPLPDDHAWLDAKSAATAVLNETMPDPTGGATHYYATSMSQAPSWSVDPQTTFKIEIGRHRFFQLPA